MTISAARLRRISDDLSRFSVPGAIANRDWLNRLADAASGARVEGLIDPLPTEEVQPSLPLLDIILLLSRSGGVQNVEELINVIIDISKIGDLVQQPKLL